jgi:hypothetical protein
VKKALAALVLAGAVGLVAAPAMADSIRHFRQSATEGFYRGQTIEYLDFGPVKLKPGNKVAPLWSITNGVEDQYNIIDAVPGQTGYSPLWHVTLVTWKSGVTPRKLTSAAGVRKALAAGQVSTKDARLVVNCPVI